MLLAAFSALAAAMRLAPLRMTSERPPAARLAPLRMSELPPLADKWAVQKLKEGVRLASKDLHFRTEDESIEVPRRWTARHRLGARGGPDGTVGLVLVDSVVDGGNAASTQAFLPGDALISVQDSAGTVEVALEGATYDATVEALGSLDPALGSLIFTVRRLCGSPSLRPLQFPGEEGRADEQLEMLPAAAGDPVARIKLNDPLALRFDSAVLETAAAKAAAAPAPCRWWPAGGAERAEVRSVKCEKARRLAARVPRRHLAVLNADSELVIRASPRNWNSRELLADVDECEVVE